MKYCSHCGKEVADEAIICPACGCAVATHSALENKDGGGTTSMVMGIVSCSLSVIGFFILGFLEFVALGLGIPGIILGSKSKRSSKGKAGLILSIIGLCLGAIGTILYILTLLTVVTLFA